MTTYPLLLTTGRVLWHYHTGSLTRRSARPGGHLSGRPRSRCTRRTRPGWTWRTARWCEVASRRGQVNVKADVTEKIQPGVVFMTFHFAESAANLLTNSAYDPVAKIPEFKACAVKVSKAARRRVRDVLMT